MSTAMPADSAAGRPPAPKDLGSEASTEGVRVSVVPTYMRDHSNPDERQYVFAYGIRITNESATPVQLISRHWVIVDANGERRDVEGEGVIGQQPRLEPGASFEYSSYCPLETPWGTMEGTYRMRRDSGETFEAEVRRFYLVAQQ